MWEKFESNVPLRLVLQFVSDFSVRSREFFDHFNQCQTLYHHSFSVPTTSNFYEFFDQLEKVKKVSKRVCLFLVKNNPRIHDSSG